MAGYSTGNGSLKAVRKSCKKLGLKISWQQMTMFIE
jgi:hypothetical protein